MKNKIILTFECVLIFGVLISSAGAFGVSSPYWDNNPLEMAKGETKTINLNLQNMVGDEDVTVKAKVIEGDSIASLSRSTYTVRAGTHDTMVPVKIAIPKDATDSKVKVEFKTVSGEDEGGAILMSTGFVTSFDVLVSEKVVEEEKILTLTPSLMLVALVCLLIIAFAVYRFRKK